jgi:GntR family transcriptional regulator/MocR family aminotransferase
VRLPRLDGEGAIYRQVYRALRTAILDGRVPPGSRLPSTRDVADDAGVARNRVVLAYRQLLDEGYVVGRVGSGTYVAAELPGDEHAGDPPRLQAPSGARTPPRRMRASRAAQQLLARGEDWVSSATRLRFDFSCGRPSFADFPRALWARLVRRRARLGGPADFDYAPPAGLPALRQAIADHLTQWRGVACTPDQVVITNGSQQALGMIAGMLLEPGDRVALEEPHYAGARQAFEAARARIVSVRVDEQGLDVARLGGRRDVRLAYVTPAHQFPTGAVLPLARRLALLAWAERANAYVVEDDYDSEYRYAGAPIESLHGLDRAGRVFYVGSFSKILSPALRLGYVVMPPALVRLFTIAKRAADLGSPTFGQQVLADFIAQGHFVVHLRRSRRRHAARRIALRAAIAQHLGDRVQVFGADAGLHVLLVLHGRSVAEVPGILRRARGRDVGVYSTQLLYRTRPRRAELMVGHGSLSETDIARGIERLSAVLLAR